MCTCDRFCSRVYTSYSPSSPHLSSYTLRSFALFGSENFPDDPATADQNEQDILLDQTYFNLPWSGVRPSNLPYALEPETDGTLNYEDPSTVDYCPICAWGGNDEPGGAQGRCARADLENLGGYTTFVGKGLLVDLPEVDQTPYLPCRKPDESCYGTNEDGSLKVTTCMAGEFRACKEFITLATLWFIF